MPHARLKSMNLSDTVPFIYTNERPKSPITPDSVRSFGMTDAGRVRQTNEDQFAIVELARTMRVHGTSIPQAKAQYSSHRGHIFLVADRMGGHQGGEVASTLGVMSVEGFLLNSLNRFFNLKASDEHQVLSEFQSVLVQTDAKLFDEAAQHPELFGMGTTLTLAFIVDWRLFVAHVGDSRCYIFSKNALHQLTEDHSIVAELVRRGALSPKEASRHPGRHVVTNVLGGNTHGAQVEVHKLDVEPDDVVLLCSDGLSGMVSDDHIAAVIREENEPQRICERLVAQANENGGKDNITVVATMCRASDSSR